LRAIRSGLRAQIAASPLGQHEKQASCFGAAIRACWREWCEKPAVAA